MTLRPYQLDCIERVNAAAARGVRRQLGVAATGLGKTVIFVALARDMAVRTLVIAHRDELIEQAAANVRTWWPDADVGIVKGDRDEIDKRVVVASVQTLSRPERLARLLEPSIFGDAVPFGLVVVDEAHHAAADSYRTVLHGLRCGEPDGPLLLGVTATPDRGDGKGLDDLFDEVTFAYDIRWGIAREYLSDLKGMRVQLAADMSALKVTAGDYNAGQAGQMLEDAHAPAMIARAWLQHARGRRTLVFTPTVALAEAVAAEFAERGVAAAHVDGTMETGERRALLAAYSEGMLDVLVNCQILTEGYDEPRTDCIVIARPTKSRALYTQMIGRGTRRHPDKTDCLVIDIVGATEMHALVTVPSLFGIESAAAVWERGLSITDALHEQIDRHAVEGKLLAVEAELFDKVKAGKFAWAKVHQPGEARRYTLHLGRVGRCVMVQLPDDTWRGGYADKDNNKRVLVDHATLELAQGACEDQARRLGAARMASTDAAWRTQRPTRKQREFAKTAKIDLPVGCTKGQASELISAYMDRRKSKKVSRS